MASKNKQNIEVRNLRLVLIGVISLQILLLLVTMGLKSKRGGLEDAATNPSSFFPFWLVVFIPIIAAKKGNISDRDQKRGFWVLIGISFLVLLSMSAFLLGSLT